MIATKLPINLKSNNLIYNLTEQEKYDFVILQIHTILLLIYIYPCLVLSSKIYLLYLHSYLAYNTEQFGRKSFFCQDFFMITHTSKSSIYFLFLLQLAHVLIFVCLLEFLPELNYSSTILAPYIKIGFDLPLKYSLIFPTFLVFGG